jgi:hypothetical protein
VKVVRLGFARSVDKMFKPRWTILINTPSQVIRLKGYKTELLARYDASLWAREGYEIIIRREKPALTEGWHYFLLALLLASPYVIVGVLGL